VLLPNDGRTCLALACQEVSAFQRSPDSLDLSKVKQVVAGIEAQEMFDALLAPLGMHADAL
jgi:hypothetical protein